MKILASLFFSFLYFSNLFAFDDKLILELKPQNRYDQSMKYEKRVEEYKDKKNKKKSNIEIDIGVDVDKDEKAIDKVKIDMGKNF